MKMTQWRLLLLFFIIYKKDQRICLSLSRGFHKIIIKEQKYEFLKNKIWEREVKDVFQPWTKVFFVELSQRRDDTVFFRFKMFYLVLYKF